MSSGLKKTTKMIAATLAVLTAVLTPTVFLGQNKVFAAAAKTKYIKEIRVFSGTHKDQGDAEDWCKKQPENKDNDPDNDWAVFSDNLDKGADGALKKSVGVYLCYQTTTDPKEAVRDLAVMNEKGNYSEGAYERILKEQREMYADLVNDSKNMIEEYRANYKAGLPTAVQAHDFMNTYKEDDSGKLFGDFMLTVNDEELTEVLLQANGMSVMMMQEQLAYACDTGKSTWLDRMAQLGSYEALRKQALKTCNNDAKKADRALTQKYNETAKIIAENWNDIYLHFESIKTYAKTHGLEDMSAEQMEAYYKQLEQESESNTLDAEGYAFMQEQAALAALGLYKYGDGTLMDYFDRPKDKVSGDNIKELYPLAASLSKGQLSALNETVSLFSLLINAQSATVQNPYKKGMSVEMQDVDAEAKQDAENMQNNGEKALDEWKKTEPISIYSGIERGIFKGSVAVTSNAESYGKSNGTNWTDSFVESGGLLGTSIALGVGSIACTVASVIFARLANALKDPLIYHGAYNMVILNFSNKVIDDARPLYTHAVQRTLENYTSKHISMGAEGVKALAKSQGWKEEVTLKTMADFKETRKAIFDKMLEGQKELVDTQEIAAQISRYKLYRGLEIGMAVAAIAIAVADITMTVIELYKYYNRDHLPIPKYMVDLSYNENLETSFIAYRGVLDQDGDQGDLNGGGGKQWLALYASYDEDAGDPILAPDGDLYKGITQRGKSTTPDGYSPLHFFGKPNAPQNLTFADGDNGWSYNDDEGGTYFFFERDKNWNTANTENAATALSFGTVALIGGIGLLLGFALATLIFTIHYKKKSKTK